MKQHLYSCSQCGKRETVEALDESAPSEWATIRYERRHVAQLDGEIQMASEIQMVITTSETHACGDCAPKVLDLLEPPIWSKASERGM